MSRCNPHGCHPFNATHVVKLGDKRWFVHAEVAKNRTQYFMRAEWDLPRGTPSAWYVSYGVLRLRGGTVRGAELVAFASWPREPGWDDDGWPDDAARADDALDDRNPSPAGFNQELTPAQRAFLRDALAGPFAVSGRGESRVARSCEAKGLGKLDEMTGIFTINDEGRRRATALVLGG